VWGGIAGCFPVVIGWAAATNSVSFAALALFMVVFFWTPPHYWPLSMKFADDYNAAGVPMLGAVAQPARVAQSIIRYSWATVITSLAYAPLVHASVVYWLVAGLAGGWFLWESYRLRANIDDVRAPMRLFHGSISYLTLVFIAVGVDAFLR
jgi:protoheme IX farnesyltransferase